MQFSASIPSLLKAGDDSRENWKTINQLAELARLQQSEIERLRKWVADQRRWPDWDGGDGGSGGARWS